MAGSIAAEATVSPAPSYTYTHPHNDKSHSNTEKTIFNFNLCLLQPIVSGGSQNQLPLGGFP